jgi:serine/threonine protein kinase
VALYDLDETTRSLAMEYVAGGTIRERLRVSAHSETGGLDPEETAALARSLLAALAYVHAAGVIHGDIKPGNVLLRSPGEAVLADFGAAQLAAAQLAGGIEPDDRPAGTPLYLAPEQLRGSPASELSDLYSAGAILWEATAGHPLREGVDLLRPFPTPPPPLPVAALDPLGERGVRLARLITRLVAFNPSDRPASAAAALASL